MEKQKAVTMRRRKRSQRVRILSARLEKSPAADIIEADARSVSGEKDGHLAGSSFTEGLGKKQ